MVSGAGMTMQDRSADGTSQTEGTLVLVVGPSGAGKDTLIAHAKAALRGDDRFHFVRRVVTRDGLPVAEDHESLSPAAFAAARAAGKLPLSWQAHGLDYGVPRASLAQLEEGRVVIANVSRGIIAEARRSFGRVRVLHVTASPETLARRLKARGREDEADISRRLSRAAAAVAGPGVTEIGNDGTIEAAGQRMVELLLAIAAE